MVARTAVFLIVFLSSSTTWSGERGEIGLRLEQRGIVWTVIMIVPGGAADRAGLRVDDAIIQINNRHFPTAEQLSGIVSQLDAGDIVKLTVLGRQGQVKSYELEATPRSD